MATHTQYKFTWRASDDGNGTIVDVAFYEGQYVHRPEGDTFTTALRRTKMIGNKGITITTADPSVGDVIDFLNEYMDRVYSDLPNVTEQAKIRDPVLVAASEIDL